MEKLKQYAEFCSHLIVLAILLAVSVFLCYYSNVLGKSIPQTITEQFKFYFNDIGFGIKNIGINLGAALALISFGSGIIGLNFRYEFGKGLKIASIVFGILVIIIPGFMFLGKSVVTLFIVAAICAIVFFIMDIMFSEKRASY